MRCLEADIYAVRTGLPFHQHFEVRTVSPAAEVLGPEYFLDVRHRLGVSNCLHVTGYVNDNWRDVTFMLPWMRVRSVSPLVMVQTQPIIETGLAPESGFVVEQSAPFVVRFDGRRAGAFDTMAEAQEFVKRDGYAVRRESKRTFAQQRGVDVQEFPDSRAAWKWISEQMKSKTQGR